MFLKVTHSYEVEDIEPQEDGKPLYVILIVVASGRFYSWSQTLSSYVKVWSYIDHPSPGQGCIGRKSCSHEFLPRVSYWRNRVGFIPRHKLFLPRGSCCFSKGHSHSRPSKHHLISTHLTDDADWIQNSGTAYYKLKFEDDDDQEHMVSAAEVVEWPGQ